MNAANDGMVSSSRLPISHITPANVGTDEMLGSSRLMHTGGTPKECEDPIGACAINIALLRSDDDLEYLKLFNANRLRTDG